MSELFIFGGTTEGRELAEYCDEKNIPVSICVTTKYGAKLLPESRNVKIITGRLNSVQMMEIIKNKYRYVIDATHPYAVEATENIKSACAETGVEYIRLVRENTEISCGISAENMDGIIDILNQNEKTILSTLGSKELERLKEVRNFRERIWARVLPADNIRELCVNLGYDKNRLIFQKGPFTEEENITHIKRSGAEILVTKDSGAVGGYPEKVSAVEKCGIELVVLKRPSEKGYSIEEVKNIISKAGD